MTLSTSGYTVGSNRPLTHARILWAPITGAVTADGAGGDLAANDYTWQRWTADTYPASWTITTDANADVDTLFIAGHNLGSVGATVVVATSTITSGLVVSRATVVPTDDSTIAVMFSQSTGAPHVVRRVRVTISGGTGPAQVGIIRAGKALQMEQPVFGGVRPIGLNRVIETRAAISETGQWLGRTIQRRALSTEMVWEHLRAAWYRANFEPFARVLPVRPFGLIQNPARMPESVAWCWTDAAPKPSNMGVRDFMTVELPITGFLE
jgi:hypothetical protein